MAGFRPGFGFGGKIHCLLMEMGGWFPMPGIGASGLFTVEEVAGVRTCGKTAAFGEETEPPVGGAPVYGCISEG